MDEATRKNFESKTSTPHKAVAKMMYRRCFE